MPVRWWKTTQFLLVGLYKFNIFYEYQINIIEMKIYTDSIIFSNQNLKTLCLHTKYNFMLRIHSHITRPRWENCLWLNIIVFSNLQKHSMNFKFSYKWFLFMPNERLTREAREKWTRSEGGRRNKFFDKWVSLIETATFLLCNEFPLKPLRG